MQSSNSNIDPNLQVPINHWPQGARPKTTNQHLPANQSLEQSLQQSSSSGSTLTEDPPQRIVSPNNDEDEEFDEDTDDDEVDKMLAGRIPDEKADTSSMSSIEILNMPASNEWDVGEDRHQERLPVMMEPLMCSSALSVDTGELTFCSLLCCCC